MMKLQKIRRKFNLPYHRQLLIYSIVLSVIPILLIGFISATLSMRTIQHEVDEKQQLTLQQLKYQVDTFIHNIEFASIQITNDLTIAKSLDLGISMDDPETLQVTLDLIERIKSYRSFSEIQYDVSLIYQQFGYVYSSKHGIIPIHDYPYRSLSQAYPDAKEHFILVPPKAYADQEQLILIRPIHGTSNHIKGLLVLEVDANRFYDFFQSLKMSHNSELFIVDAAGRIVMSQSHAQIGQPFYPSFDDPLQHINLPGHGKNMFLNNKEYRLSTEQSAMNQWSYIALTPLEALTEKSTAIRYLTWIIASSVGAIWILISVFGSNKLHRPLKHLAVQVSEQHEQQTTEQVDVLKTIDQYIQTSKQLTKQLQTEMKNRLPGMKEYVFLQLLNGEISENSFRKQASQYEIPLQGKFYYVCVVAIDQYIEFKQQYIGKDRSLMMYALGKTIQEICEEHQACYVISQEPTKFTFIFNAENNDEQTVWLLQQICDKIRDQIYLYFHWSVTISFSEAKEQLNQIHEGFLEAQELHNLSFWIGKNRTLYQRNLSHLRPILITYRELAKSKKQLLKLLAEGEVDGAEQQLIEITQSILKHQNNSPQVGSFFAQLIGEVDRILEESGTDLVKLFGDDIYEWVYSRKTTPEYTDWFQSSFFPTIRQYLGSLNSSEKATLIRQTLHYIHNNFETDFSLQCVADQLNVQPYNLSRYFKEEMDMNFIDYVIQYRMNKAKEWLVYSDMSIKEIAERLRYASTQNFTRVFKQLTGMPPGRFREQRRMNEQS